MSDAGRGARRLLGPGLGLLAAIGALVLWRPFTSVLGLSELDLSWLARAHGLWPRLVDMWIGAVSDDRLMRLPALVCAILLVAAVWVGLRPAGVWLAFWASAAAIARVALFSGALRIASDVPLAAIVSALTFICLLPSNRSKTAALFAIAAGATLLDPAAGAFPLGAALASLGSASRTGRGRLRALGLAVCALALIFLVRHPVLEWHLREPMRTATYGQMLGLLIVVAVLAWRALRPSHRNAAALGGAALRDGAASGGRSGAAIGERIGSAEVAAARFPSRSEDSGDQSGAPILIPILGGLAAALAFLIVHPAHEVWSTALTSVLILGGPLVAVSALGAGRLGAGPSRAAAPSPGSPRSGHHADADDDGGSGVPADSTPKITSPSAGGARPIARQEPTAGETSAAGGGSGETSDSVRGSGETPTAMGGSGRIDEGSGVPSRAAAPSPGSPRSGHHADADDDGDSGVPADSAPRLSRGPSPIFAVAAVAVVSMGTWILTRASIAPAVRLDRALAAMEPGGGAQPGHAAAAGVAPSAATGDAPSAATGDAPAAATDDASAAAAGDAPPAVQEVMVGHGLTRGALAHAARSRHLTVTLRPTQGVVGMVAMAAAAPTLEERNSVAERLGDRVLERYGVVSEPGPALRWAVFRPLHLSANLRSDKPNIAIVSIDTLRADHLGCYGYTRPTSPRLDRWARSSRLFERAMSTAPATAPSFSSLMTGRLPISHGVRKNYEFLDPGNWTLARILRRAGYDTAAFVSSFVLTAENSGLDLGFDTYDQHLEAPELNRRNRPVRLGPALLRAVNSWLDGRTSADKPFFLWVHAIDPHGPYTPLKDFAGVFKSTTSRVLSHEAIPAYQWLGSLEFETYVDNYDDEILQADTYVGAIIERIEKMESMQATQTGQAGRGTIVIFVADHGEALGEHGVYFEHGQSLHVEELHVPLVINDSTQPAAGRVSSLVSLVDIAPSLLARIGIQADLPFDGMTLDERQSANAPITANWRPGQAMASKWPWKVMLEQKRKDPSPVTKIYNVGADPAESTPLEPSAGVPPSLLKLARAIFDRDPLSPSTARALDRQQWEELDHESRENLKSLGYAGP